MLKKITIIAMIFCSLLFAQEQETTPKPENTGEQKKGVLEIKGENEAGVWLNGEAAGNIPFSMEVPEGFVNYSVKAAGYWSQTAIATIKAGEVNSQSVELKKYNFPVPKQYDISGANDIKLLEAMYDSLSKLKPEAPPDSICLSKFVEDYPLPVSAPEPLTDSSAEYQNYYQAYIADREQAFGDWYSGCTKSLQLDLNSITDKINSFKNEQLVGFVPVVDAKFEPSAPSSLKGDLTLYFYSEDARAEVAWKGTWENGNLRGDDLVKALTASSPLALSFLTVQNQTVWIPKEEGYSRHYFKYKGLNISWNGHLFPMKGEFYLPDYILAQLPEEQLDTAKIETVPDSAVIRANYAKIPGGMLRYKGESVHIKPFLMQTSAVSQADYSAKCGEKDFGKFKGDSLPAHSVNWKEANECCVRLGADLPTEAEWEYAARAGSSYPYMWNTTNAADYAVFNTKKPSVTGTKKPNGWGLYDMFGNVSQWVKDDGFWFGKYKFFKGGNYKTKKAADLTFENNEEEDARYWGTHVGFRCVVR